MVSVQRQGKDVERVEEGPRCVVGVQRKWKGSGGSVEAVWKRITWCGWI